MEYTSIRQVIVKMILDGVKNQYADSRSFEMILHYLGQSVDLFLLLNQYSHEQQVQGGQVGAGLSNRPVVLHGSEQRIEDGLIFGGHRAAEAGQRAHVAVDGQRLRLEGIGQKTFHGVLLAIRIHPR